MGDDPFLLAADDLAAERPLEEEEWIKGKSIQISGLEPSTGYLVRLIATNDAGTTHGDIAEIITKAPKDPSGGGGVERKKKSDQVQAETDPKAAVTKLPP